ncbi:MAG: hypothetical protein MPK11_06160 [Gammaproteobacteria bacterium]|nr:hypothetical protein [Gammaproteobacteria bacterium]MDA7996220.1 hypothetical protein [Gammaproteobacteria bacterium]MDA8024518.1 hypothetical protein [Gammaproteobacteria bacterium]CAJ2377628.1 MAG: membrane hypothetical protein [Arenicellales bacterium IbO2]
MLNPLLSGLGGGAAWLWLVLVPVSGWLVMHSRCFRSYMWRAVGHNRYFLIVFAGIFTFTAGLAVANFFKDSLPDPLAGAGIWGFLLGLELPFDYSALFWSAPLGFVFGIFLHLFAFALHVGFLFIKGFITGEETVDEARAQYLAEVNGILDFVVEADKRELIAMLTLRNRKVYIGWPLHLSDWNNPRPTNQHLYFLPLRSGYRAEDTLEMVPTTNYVKAYRHFGVKPSDEAVDWEIILPVNEIIHVQPFDPDFYEEIQRINPPTQK